MNDAFSKRALVRIISFSAAVGLLIVGAAVSGYRLTSRYRNTTEYKYQLALNNLSDYMILVAIRLNQNPVDFKLPLHLMAMQRRL